MNQVAVVEFHVSLYPNSVSHFIPLYTRYMCAYNDMNSLYNAERSYNSQFIPLGMDVKEVVQFRLHRYNSYHLSFHMYIIGVRTYRDCMCILVLFYPSFMESMQYHINWLIFHINSIWSNGIKCRSMCQYEYNHQLKSSLVYAHVISLVL